jgi:hypothetical protein
MGIAGGGQGMLTTPLLGKIFDIDRENLLHRKKIIEIDCENPGFFKKRPPDLSVTLSHYENHKSNVSETYQ